MGSSKHNKDDGCLGKVDAPFPPSSHPGSFHGASPASESTLQRVWSVLRFRPTFDSRNFLLSTVPLYPYLLPVLRLSFAIYMIVVAMVYFSTNEVEAGKAFFFLTNLCYITLLLYFAVTGIHSILTLRYAARSGPAVQHSQLYMLFVQTLYSINMPMHLLITVIYWPIIHPHFIREYQPGLLLHWINVSVHALPFAFCLAEFCLNRMHFYPSHVIVIFNAGLIYMCMLIAARFIFMVNGVPYYPYLFLAWEDKLSPLYHVALFLFVIFTYFVVMFAHRLKYTYFVDPVTAQVSAVLVPAVFDEESTIACSVATGPAKEDPVAAKHNTSNHLFYSSLWSAKDALFNAPSLPAYAKAESIPLAYAPKF